MRATRADGPATSILQAGPGCAGAGTSDPWDANRPEISGCRSWKVQFPGRLWMLSPHRSIAALNTVADSCFGSSDMLRTTFCCVPSVEVTSCLASTAPEHGSAFASKASPSAHCSSGISWGLPFGAVRPRQITFGTLAAGPAPSIRPFCRLGRLGRLGRGEETLLSIAKGFRKEQPPLPGRTEGFLCDL